jgi:hypothetical protein
MVRRTTRRTRRRKGRRAPLVAAAFGVLVLLTVLDAVFALGIVYHLAYAAGWLVGTVVKFFTS